jgi:hypothetical protein
MGTPIVLKSEIREYITIVAKTLEMVFDIPREKRTEIISSLRSERDKDYWEITLHYLPLYSAADLAGVRIVYPDFDVFEERYARLVEGKGLPERSPGHDQRRSK